MIVEADKSEIHEASSQPDIQVKTDVAVLSLKTGN